MVGLYNLKGEKVSSMDLPEVFKTEVRGDLIKRAVIAAQSHRLQAYGPNWFSGKNTSAFSYGPGRGLSRIPRVRGGGPASGRGSIVPHAVGGRKAHPPLPERNIQKKINKKERKLAITSAIAATGLKEHVESRGHKLKNITELPIIVVDEFEGLKRTSDVKEALSNLGLDDDLNRTKERKIRSGKGTKRGRKYKRGKSVLLVVSNGESIKKGALNIAGVSVTTAKDLNAEDLAPGANAARLTVYTSSAIRDLEKRFKERS
jgi:large subunit ribosomal protein L4e